MNDSTYSEIQLLESECDIPTKEGFLCVRVNTVEQHDYEDLKKCVPKGVVLSYLSPDTVIYVLKVNIDESVMSYFLRYTQLVSQTLEDNIAECRCVNLSSLVKVMFYIITFATESTYRYAVSLSEKLTPESAKKRTLQEITGILEKEGVFWKDTPKFEKFGCLYVKSPKAKLCEQLDGRKIKAYLTHFGV